MKERDTAIDVMCFKRLAHWVINLVVDRKDPYDVLMVHFTLTPRSAKHLVSFHGLSPCLVIYYLIPSFRWSLRSSLSPPLGLLFLANIR